ncbi:MAG: rcp1 3 [Bacteroidetes bacterium]|nr:rcp1 3 [Bacteroidota bacterium]
MNHTEILLVDDDLDDQMFFKDVLSEIYPEIKCNIAGHGLEALLYLNSDIKFPSLIFLDLNMPVMNGFECLQKLKGDNRFKKIPVIIISTSSNPYDMEKAREMGAEHFFTKPADYLMYKENLFRIFKNF